MTIKEEYATDQEKFWAGEFGTDYIERNEGDQLLASNLNFFSKALRCTQQVSSCLEFGANIGMNLKALQLLYPRMSLKGIEINNDAAKQLIKLLGDGNVHIGSIFDYPIDSKVNLALIKGVLIHINPNKLQAVYEQLYKVSNKYILVAEYYNPSPVAIPYRGHN